MEATHIANNKNGSDGSAHDKHFMEEKEIQIALQGKIEGNRNHFKGKKLTIGAKKTVVVPEEDGSASSKQAASKEGNPLSWIEPDEDEHHHATKHAEEKHKYTYRHMEELDDQRQYTCNTLTDKWYEWHLKTPASISAFTNPSQSYEDQTLLGGSNAFLFQDNSRTFKDSKDGDDKFSIYFAAASPFHEPDIRTITMLKQVPLLVPVYNMSASPQDHPSKTEDEDLKKLIIEDLSGIIEINASFDREPIEGCCVIRQKRLSVTNIPKDNVIGIPEDRLIKSGNTIETCHGGYWLLIRKEVLTPGDHLLDFSAISKNYELNVKILINVLV
jgi:hypothetical protein